MISMNRLMRQRVRISGWIRLAMALLLVLPALKRFRTSATSCIWADLRVSLGLRGRAQSLKEVHRPCWQQGLLHFRPLWSVLQM